MVEVSSTLLQRRGTLFYLPEQTLCNPFEATTGQPALQALQSVLTQAMIVGLLFSV